jgi:hypothetical protein
LWEYDIDGEATTDRLDRVVIERVMERGGWDAMRWLLRSYERARLRSYLEHRGRRVLPARELRFWTWVCDVPEAMASTWVRRARAKATAWRG